MTSGRESLMLALKTDLEGINGASPYTNDVKLVSRDVRSLSGMAVFPSIVLLDADEDEERTASNHRLFFILNVLVLVYTKVSPSTDSSTSLNSIAADVKYALISTTKWTHGNTCHRSLYRGMDPLAVEGRTIAGVVMRFGFHYSHTWDQP